MRNSLATALLGVPMKSPVIAASGTFGFGREYAEIADISELGGISGKGLTLEPSPGNRGERIWETASGLLNSIGLENPGVRHFVEEEAPRMRALGCAVIANLGGHTEQEYAAGAELLNQADIDILELNISCPNVRAGGMAFGMECRAAGEITRLVKARTRHPLLVKLSPNAHDVVAVAKACEQAGADGLSLVNTFLGMWIDTANRRPVFDNVYAGLSGPAVLPIALRMVHQVAKAVAIPVVGGGGIHTADHALQFLMAGACAVQVGSAIFCDPGVLAKIIAGLAAYCEKHGLENIQEICGII